MLLALSADGRDAYVWLFETITTFECCASASKLWPGILPAPRSSLVGMPGNRAGEHFNRVAGSPKAPIHSCRATR